MAIQLYNEIEIFCTPEKLFLYVTQPWRWHEWHPDSRGARSDKQVLCVGDTFDETIEVKPFNLLPFTVKRHPRYVVRESSPHASWAAEGEFSDGWLAFRYEIEPRGCSVLFKRTMQFKVRGIMRLLVPVVRRKQERKSLVALAALKRKLEADA